MCESIGWVRLGSCFHQFNPICSALSTEQINRRMRIVSNSTLANEMRTSPAITRPLSRIRSRMSIRFVVVPETLGTRSIGTVVQQHCSHFYLREISHTEWRGESLSVRALPNPQTQTAKAFCKLAPILR